jgi:urease accessory protein
MNGFIDSHATPTSIRLPRINHCVADTPANRIRSGHSHLKVEVVDGQSAVTSAWAASPLKLLIPRPRGPSAWAYLSNFGGGMVAGDETGMELELGERACCFVSTQASTKVYRNPNARPCSHWMRAKLAVGSLLAYAPDSVQAFAGSHYQQRQTFLMQPGSGLVLVDWVCSGRSACGERWAFSRFQSRNEVFLGDQRVFIDSLLMDPAAGPLDGSHRMGRFNCLALVLIFGEPLRAAGERVLADIAAQPVRRCTPLVCSVSALSQGALVRMAGESTEDVAREIRRHLAFLPALLHEDPWSRKW